ncbi:MAG: glycosyltransferase family 2 protein [Acidobacteria bacterium]|nr:glycosyltransferase family 2 protein [Acidobacteriota bacterium]
MKSIKEAVSVTIVTHDSEPSLARCLDSVLEQDCPELEIIVVDNASRDGTRAILERYRDRVKIVHNPENRGFSAAQNQAIGLANGEWVLALNPDVLLAPNFVSCLLRAGSLNPAVGTVCGKLFRAGPGLQIPPEKRLDSAGIYFTPTFRHFDRGMHLPDGEAYNQPGYVFGATAAAALYRRRMIEDVSIEKEFFDEDFFFYREDADVSWRSQLLGWKCLYIPDAVGYHVRRVFPECRRQLPLEINLHSVKNRFLMRVKNVTLPLYGRNFLAVTARDIAILFYCLLSERTSLPAFAAVLRNWGRALAKRRIIQQRRRVSNAYLQAWFRFRPVIFPAGPELLDTPNLSPTLNRGTRSLLPLPTARAEPGQFPQL